MIKEYQSLTAHCGEFAMICNQMVTDAWELHSWTIHQGVVYAVFWRWVRPS